MADRIGDAFRKAMEGYQPVPIDHPDKDQPVVFIKATKYRITLYSLEPGKPGDEIGIECFVPGLPHSVIVKLTPTVAREMAAELIDAAKRVEELS